MMSRSRLRIFAFLLAALLLTSLFACGSENPDQPSDSETGPDETEETTQLPLTEPPYELELPENLDFGGKAIRILTGFPNDPEAGSNGYNQYAGELLVEDMNSDPVNDAIFNREMYVEDLLNVDIERVRIPASNSNVKNFLSDLQASGDIAGEIGTDSSANIVWAAPRGFARDLTSLDNLDLSNSWWSQDFTKECSISNRVFFATGDIALSTLRLTHVVLYNKKVASDHGIPDLYPVVFDGNWTIDYLTEVTADVYRDLNGNSEVDEEDEFGLVYTGTSNAAFWAAFDLKVFGKDDEDHLTYVMDQNHDRVVSAIEKIRDLTGRRSTYFDAQGDDRFSDLTFRSIANDTALLAFGRLGHTESSILRNMTSEYGILPFPKYDAAQKDYQSFPHDDFTCFCIPSTLPEEDAEAAAAVLEAMGWYSKCYVTPTYLDVALKGKYANDPETRKVIDLITANIKIEAAWEYAYVTNGMPYLLSDLVNEPSLGIASEIQKKESRIEKQLWSLNYQIDELP